MNKGIVELATLKAGEVFKIAEHDFIVLEQMDGMAAVKITTHQTLNR